MNSVFRIAISLFFGLSCSGCDPLIPEASAPVPVRWYRISESPVNETTLLVMLPGRRSQAEDFEKHGFIGAMKPGGRYDAVAVDLHLGYYRDKSVDVRLREDVIEPAREKGYRRIEILGISLGGLGGLIYSLQMPGDIDRLTLLSPYLGDEPVIEEIAGAGGLAKWKPGMMEESDFQRKLWSRLKRWQTAENRSSAPEIRIAVGDRDRLRSSNEFFAHELLEGRILHRPGKHDWKTWKRLYLELFDLNPPQS